MTLLQLDAEALYADLRHGVRALLPPEAALVGIWSGGAWLADQAKKAASGDEAKELVRLPPGLSPGARLRWQELAPILLADGRLRRETRDILKNYCVMAAECDTLSERILAEGHVVRTPHASLPHPCCKVLSGVRSTLLKYGQVLGLDPSSRSRLEAAGVLKETPSQEEDELDRLMFA